MKTKTKVLIGVTAALLVILPLMSISVMAEDIYEDESNVSSGSLEERIKRFIIGRMSQQQRQHSAVWFFKGAKSVTVEGTVTVHHGNILIVTTSEGQRLNIVLPRVWNIDSEVVRLYHIFEEGYVSIGDEVTVEALNRTVTNDNGVTVTFIFGYEIIDETNGNHFYAVIPFNINK